jgi:transposase
VEAKHIIGNRIRNATNARSANTDRASWHTGDKAKKWENIVPLFQPPKSPELNPVEHLWHHVREKGNFKNHTFHSLCEVERHLMAELNKLSLNFETVKNITRFKWIKNIL